MKNSKTSVVIVGAGMAGMLAALLVKKRAPNADVAIVERSTEAGGNFRGLQLDGFGYCDRAMRLLYETGIPEFDELLHNILPENEWRVLPDNVKDVVGVFWRGKLQTHSPYIDLRRLPEDEYRRCEAEVLACVRDDSTNGTHHDAEYFLKHRFGATAGNCLTRVLEKFYRVPASELDEFATHQPAMNRIVLYDENKMQPLMEHDAIRSVLAWPDQLTLPVKRKPAQSGLYPRRFGMNRVIEAMSRQLEQQGVRFLFNRKIASLQISDNRIAATTLDNGDVLETPDLFISANGLNASLALLGKSGNGSAPSPPRSWMVFLRTKSQPNMGGVYHCWCFDEAYDTFRVTNYSNYCPDAKNEEGFPLCVEVWSADENASQAIERAVREVQQMNIVQSEDIVARAAVPTMNMHALCTRNYVQHLRAMRNEVKNRSPENMITVGPFTEDGVMLLYEVSRAMHGAIASRL